MNQPTPPGDDSLGDFIRDAMRDHDAGLSVEPEQVTQMMDGQKREATLGALPGHEVAGLLGRGGMGSVYRARQVALEREVAVKVLTDEAEEPEMTERFRREAVVLGRLAHPNIVPVHDIGHDEHGHVFYTMKVVEGRTLQAILHDLRAKDAETLRIHTLPALLTVFRKVCDALAFAHSQGVLHRDLKPENVMVGAFGEVLVMDWGLAKMMSDKEEAPRELSPSSMVLRRSDFGGTMQGSVMGTPQYMSPEQARGHIDELDERSDIFSLGGILYAILTLRPPVEGATLDEVLKKVGAAQITSPSDYQAGTHAKGKETKKGDVLEAKLIRPLPHVDGGRVPAALSAVAMKALSLDKAQRYQSVAELSADIEAYQGGFATKAEHAGIAKQLLLLVRRNRGIFATAAAAWLLITALAVWFILNLRAKEQRAVAGEEAAKASEAVAVQEKEAARRSSATANLNLADAALRDGDSAGVQSALNAVPEDLRDSTWGYLLGQSDTSIARLTVSDTSIMSVAADPTRPGVFAVIDERRKIIFVEPRTGTRLVEFPDGFTKKPSTSRYRLTISPDGQRIAVGVSGTGGIVILDTRDGKRLAAWDAPSTEQLQFSGDGRLLLQCSKATGTPGHLAMWDSADGRLLWKYEPREGYAFGDFAPDGQQVLTVGRGDEVRVVKPEDGTLVRSVLSMQAAGITARITAFAVGAADLLAITDDALNVSFVNWREGRLISRFQHEATRDDLKYIAWLPDGTQLVTAVKTESGRQAIRLWNGATGSMVRALLGGVGVRYGLAVHPLSGELLVVGESSRVWSLTGVPPRWTMPFRPPIAFWGSDDVIFAPPKGGDLHAVQRLQGAGRTTIWSPPAKGYRDPRVSADGRLAALVSPNGKEEQIMLLRREGDRMEPSAITSTMVTSLTRPDYVRLSPAGGFVAGFHLGGLAWASTADPKSQIRVERGDVRTYNDVAWLTEQRLLGVVTAKAGRLQPGSEEQLVVWEASTGKVVQTATHDSAMNLLAVAPDGRRFAEAGTEKTVRIRDGATLAVLREFRAHDGAITALAWHPQRAVLATASTDLTIRLWDLETGRRLEELTGPPRPVFNLVFSPSGHRLGSASDEDSTRIWEPASMQEKKEPAAGDWEDLLATLTPEIVAQTGQGWRLDGGVLFSPDRKFAPLPLPTHFAGGSYRVRVKLRQLTPKRSFSLFLPVAEGIVAFTLESHPERGRYTGLGLVDGKALQERSDSVPGKVVKDSEQHDLETTVKFAGPEVKITTTLDGQPLHEWTGLAAALSLNSEWKVSPHSLGLGTQAADWVVYEVKVKRLEQ